MLRKFISLNVPLQIWEHPSLGSEVEYKMEGARFLAGIRPCPLESFNGICSIKDAGSRCGTSLVVGHPDGVIMVFQQQR